MVGNRNRALWFHWNATRRASRPAFSDRAEHHGVLPLALQQKVAMKQEGSRIVETAVEARERSLGWPILLVLVVSMALTVVLLAAIYAGMLYAVRARGGDFIRSAGTYAAGERLQHELVATASRREPNQER
jgi:hypothetical protein